MTLDPKVIYPSTRSYVLKLRRDADPRRGQIRGRVENMASGRSVEFSSGDELLACLAQDLTSNDTDPSGPADAATDFTDAKTQTESSTHIPRRP